MLYTHIYHHLHLLIFQLSHPGDQMAHIPALNWLKRDEAGMLNWLVSDVLALAVGKSMPQKQVVAFLEPGGVAFVFLVADEAVFCS